MDIVFNIHAVGVVIKLQRHHRYQLFLKYHTPSCQTELSLMFLSVPVFFVMYFRSIPQNLIKTISDQECCCLCFIFVCLFAFNFYFCKVVLYPYLFIVCCFYLFFAFFIGGGRGWLHHSKTYFFLFVACQFDCLLVFCFVFVYLFINSMFFCFFFALSFFLGGGGNLKNNFLIFFLSLSICLFLSCLCFVLFFNVLLYLLFWQCFINMISLMINNTTI